MSLEPEIKESTTPEPSSLKKEGKNALSTYKKGPFSWLILAILIFSGLMMLQQMQKIDNIRWDQFVAYVHDGKVTSVEIRDTDIVGKFIEGTAGEKGEETFLVDYNPNIVKEELYAMLNESGVEWSFSKQRAWLWNLIGMLFPILLLVVFFYFIFAKNMKGGAGGMLMSFGRSKHRIHVKDKVKVTFKDVAGIQEAKEEVSEIVTFLQNPKKFQRLGGRIPRGVLLNGPPGCGKTLLAKAIAGEADVPFFSISGSDFVEMFVGVGASRVRDLFRQAKESSPCIIYLDEIDAIGRKRGPGFAGGGHDEREQTLNAILVEMDGFDTNDQVIVIAATNRSDILDTALTRPGRFDRQVTVPLPDLQGRVEILKVHARKVRMSPNAELERLARGTPMFSGADLAAIINEAALMASMANKDYVETEDLEEARDKVRWGKAKRSRVQDKKEKEVVAFHEAGHTLIQCLLEDADPLHKVSIIPRGPMGGATFALPEKDRTIFTRRYCRALLQVCFGGRIAEELFCDDISSGAQSDIEQATRIARQMVLSWGMSENLGPISYLSDDSGKYYGMAAEKDYSEHTAQLIDGEIKRICNDAFNQAKDLIKANRDKLQKIADALLKYETLDAAEVTTLIEGGTIDKPTVSDLLAAEKVKKENEAAENKDSEKDKA